MSFPRTIHNFDMWSCECEATVAWQNVYVKVSFEAAGPVEAKSEGLRSFKSQVISFASNVPVLLFRIMIIHV